MSANKLTAQLSVVAARATVSIGDEVRGAIQGLRDTAPQYLAEAEEAAEKAARYLAQGAAGEIPLDMAQEAAQREAGALELIAAKAVEKTAQDALRRAQKAIQIATDAGITMMKIAIAAAVGA